MSTQKSYKGLPVISEYKKHIKSISVSRFDNFIQESEKFKKNYFPKELIDVIESCIEVHGNAWCMDVSLERKKMAKLIFRLLNDLKLSQQRSC